MGLVKRLLGDDGLSGRGEDYLDLAQYAADAPAPESDTSIQVAEVTAYADVGAFTEVVYRGNILVADLSHVAKDEILMKRIVNDLRKVATDVKGDVAGIGENLVVVTPGGLRVDRRKLRAASTN
ncbi:MAG TPA: cell division protein SepF [Candidatus Thermoplasmatota archaeon]|nr:cell division protein SepF [Candidatus Thermoplasmatota archaeon]